MMDPSTHQPAEEDDVRALYEEFPFPLNGHENFVEDFLKPTLGPRIGRLLDAGCGTGHIAVELAKLLPRTHVVGIDFSEASLGKARELAGKHDAENTEFVFCDLMQGTNDDSLAPFDAAISVGCLHHTPDPARGMRTIRSALADGAPFIMAVYGQYGRMETELLRRLIGKVRDNTQASQRELLPWISEILTESAFRQNRFFKVNRYRRWAQQPLQTAGRAVRLVMNRTGLSSTNESEPSSGIAAADQYLHPIVHTWPPSRWIALLEENGFAAERFVHDPNEHSALCVWDRPVERIRSERMRELLNKVDLPERYDMLDLIYRPMMHIIVCRAV